MSFLARVIEHDRRDGVSLAAIEGEIDASNAAEIGERLRRLMTNHNVALVIDLAAVTYLDSAGVNLLFELAAELDHRQQRLFLAVPEVAPIARVVSIAQLDHAATIHPTPQAALDALA